jgi:dolichol-phosphate mannosyltransferase
MSSTELSPSPPSPPSPGARARAGQALRARHNWEQLLKFSVVGASGTAINFAVFATLNRWFALHYLIAATGSFLVAVTSNYLLNRHWTFRGKRGHFAYQGLRFFVVSTLVLGLNLAILHLLVRSGSGPLFAQAVAIAACVPVNFLGNKLWSFRS